MLGAVGWFILGVVDWLVGLLAFMDIWLGTCHSQSGWLVGSCLKCFGWFFPRWFILGVVGWLGNLLVHWSSWTSG